MASAVAPLKFLAICICLFQAASYASSQKADSTTTCGGIIDSHQGTIDYKLNQTYDNYETCVWTIYNYKIDRFWIQLLEDGITDWYDWVSIFTIEQNWGVTDLGDNRIKHFATIHSKNYTEFVVPGPVIYIMFRTNAHVTSRGFSLRYHAIETDLFQFPSIYTLAHFDKGSNPNAGLGTEISASGTYVVDGPNPSVSSVVLQVRKTGELWMSLSNFRNGYNKTGLSEFEELAVYQLFHDEIDGRETAYAIARYSKNNDGPFATTSSFPLIIYFASRFGDTHQFQLDWEINEK